MTKTIGRLAVALSALTALTLTPAAAHAASADRPAATPASARAGADGIGIQGNAPTCVWVWVDQGVFTQVGHAKNMCGAWLNLKIVWAFGADGACSTVPDGVTLNSTVASAPRVFDGANLC